MREIKYQAWDKDAKRMIEWRELLDYGSGLAEYLQNPGELTFREYTGLKDKNDKEIYEGDILQWETDEGDVMTHEVVWADGDDGDHFLSGFTGKFIKDVTETIYDEHGQTIADYDGGILILGNAYENPELLAME